MVDDLAPIRNALTEGVDDLARYLIGEPTAASKRELRWGRHGSFSVVLTGKNAWRDHETNDAGGSALVAEHARPQLRAKRPRNRKSSPSSEGAS
jgi:hypothetical protein